MKKTIALLILAAALLNLSSCPASNGHGPFDVLNGRISVEQGLIDNGVLELIYPEKVTYYSTTASRSSTLYLNLYLMNATANSYTLTSTDKVEFFYTEQTNLAGMYQTNSRSGSIGVYTLSGTLYSSESSSSADSVSVSVTLPTNMVTNRYYYIGAATLIKKNYAKIATADVNKLVSIRIIP